MKNNKKYKFNMKGMLFTLGASAAVIAPVTTLVACGGSSSDKNTDDLTKLVTKVDTSHISALPQGIHAYSQSDLMADAIKYNDGDTKWNGGAAYHTLSSTVSFLKGMSEVLGWTKSDYISREHLTYIDDAAATAKTTPASTDAATQSSIKALELMHFGGPLSELQKRQAYFEVGDDGTFNAMGKFNVVAQSDAYAYPSSGVHEFTVGSEKFTTPLKRWFSYADINNPGSIKLNLNDTDHKINREIEVKDAFDKFTILPETQLIDEIAPFAKALFEKFLSLANGKISAEVMGHASIDKESVDQINFLIKNFTVTDATGHKSFVIEDQKFNEAMLKLNNGSTHWLAIKAAYLGFDKTLVSGGYEIYNSFVRDSMGIGGIWDVNTDLKGFKDMAGFSEMAHWAGAVDTQRPNNDGPVVFYASKNLQELEIANKLVADLIASPDGQKYLAGVTTAGLSYTQLLKRIELEKFVETVTDQTELVGIDKDTMTLQQAQDQVKWNQIKNQHMDLVTAYITDPSHIIALADIETHKDEIRVAVLAKLGVDLSSLQTFIDGQKAQSKLIFLPTLKDGAKLPYSDAELQKAATAHAQLSKWGIGNDWSLLTNELKRLATLSNQPITGFIFNPAVLVNSFDADTITVEIKFDSKTSDGATHHNSQVVKLYRHA